MSTGGPDLFVICKSCGSEVSPYITECPYCGNRLRKRAPKLDRDGRVAEKRRRRSPSPSLPRLRRGEIPGIRGDSHAKVTGVLLLASFAGTLLWRAALVGSHTALVWALQGTHLWWRLLVAPFTYVNTGYAFVTLGVIGLFGWLIERRLGPVPVLLLFALGAIGAAALSIAVNGSSEPFGANGAALALLTAWAVPDLLDLRAGEEVEADMLGLVVLAIAVALMPLADPEASWLADAVGVLGGLAAGFPLMRVGSR
ncbi:MAG: rhomboid family intramembrane serine protease [Solirubrobacteraceae bacterium]